MLQTAHPLHLSNLSSNCNANIGTISHPTQVQNLDSLYDILYRKNVDSITLIIHKIFHQKHLRIIRLDEMRPNLHPTLRVLNISHPQTCNNVEPQTPASPLSSINFTPSHTFASFTPTSTLPWYLFV